MSLKAIFLPWLVIRELRATLADEFEATHHWMVEAQNAMDERNTLRAQLSKFDHDGDGRIGGSKPRKEPKA